MALAKGVEPCTEGVLGIKKSIRVVLELRRGKLKGYSSFSGWRSRHLGREAPPWEFSPLCIFFYYFSFSSPPVFLFHRFHYRILLKGRSC